MNFFEPIFISFSVACVYIFFVSLYQTKYKNNPHGLTRLLLPLGIFVWADGIVLSLFWFLASTYTFLFGSLHSFLVLTSIFWIVRSFGEVIYWLLQQFSTVVKDPPETVPFSNIFPGQSVWFAMQVIWQVVLVVSLFVFFQLQ